MAEQVFNNYGVTLLRRGGKLFVRYDAGHIAVQVREDEVSEQQALRLQQGEQSAYEVLLELERSQNGATT